MRLFFTISPLHPTRPGRMLRLGAATLLLAGTAHAQAPIVTDLTPTRNALAVPRTASIAVGFNDILSQAGATQQALRVFSQQAGGRRTGTASVTVNTVIFRPNTEFKPGETVFATITTAAQNSNGQNLVRPQVFQFTTATTPSSGTFSSPQVLAVHPGTNRVVVGDVDGDGDLDLLTTTSAATNNTVSVRLNNGRGDFGASSQEVTSGSSVSDIELADIDGDGDLDLLTTEISISLRGSVLSYFNNGRGVFAAGPTYSIGPQAQSVTAADLDGDGDQDLLVSSILSIVTSFINDGAGSFRPRSLGSLGGVSSSKIVVGDVDNDGDLDVLLAGSVGQAVLNLRLNNGDGTFPTTGPQLVLRTQSDKIALGDVDGDGDLDVATTSGVYLNTGNGTFRSSPQASSAGTILGDVEGDGDLDVLLAASNTVEVRRNNGSGVFSPSQLVSTGLSTVTAFTLGDVDGTGSLDVVAVGDSNASISLNQFPNVPSPLAIRLNAGGPALATTRGAFAADQYFSANSATTTVTAPITGTTDDALYQSERYSTDGQLRYAVPVANGTYSVVLHFAETYWTQPGQRVFNIDLEGNTVRTNYDIVAKAGPLTATTETYTVQVADGVLNLDLLVPYLNGGRDQAKLSALEVVPVTAELRLNAGGPALNTSLGSFVTDQYFSAASATSSTIAPIVGTTDDALYQSERYSTGGQLSYAVPITNGTYRVVLHFAETYWTQAGQRVFNIWLEGNTVRTNYDIVAKVGPLTATTETFIVNVTDGVLNLDLVVPYLSGGRDQAKLSALEVLAETSSRGTLATKATARAGQLTELEAYPNPVTDNRFTLVYTAPQAQAGTLTLIDQLGRSVHEQPIQVQVGLNQVAVQLAQVRAGLYQLVLRTAHGQRHTQKVLVQP